MKVSKGFLLALIIISAVTFIFMGFSMEKEFLSPTIAIAAYVSLFENQP